MNPAPRCSHSKKLASRLPVCSETMIHQEMLLSLQWQQHFAALDPPGPSRDPEGSPGSSKGPSRDPPGISRDALGIPRERPGTHRDLQGPSRDPQGTHQGISRDAPGMLQNVLLARATAMFYDQGRSRDPQGTFQGPLRIPRDPPGTLLGSSGDPQGTSRDAPGISREHPGTHRDLQGASRDPVGPVACRMGCWVRTPKGFLVDS